jgi:hypothetical protein
VGAAVAARDARRVQVRRPRRGIVILTTRSLPMGTTA